MKRSLDAKTLIVPNPTWIVGSYDKEGKPNGMAAAWGGRTHHQDPARIPSDSRPTSQSPYPLRPSCLIVHPSPLFSLLPSSLATGHSPRFRGVPAPAKRGPSSC